MIRIIWRIILITICLLIFIFLFYKNLSGKGYFFVERDFSQNSRVISDFYPEERVRKIKEDNIYSEIIFQEPAYFKVRMPRIFDSAKINLKVKNEYSPVFVGLRKSGGWEWDFQPFPKLKENNSWQEIDFTFEEISYYTPDRSLEFIISAPGLNGSRKDIRIAKISILLQGRKLTFEELISRFKNYLKSKF